MQMENFAPVMFAGLVVIMLIGFPVAFSLAALGMASAFYAIEMGWFPAVFMQNLPLNIFGILSNELLLAIPFFTFMGAILEKCGLAEDMLDSMGQLFGPVKGGLGGKAPIRANRAHEDGRSGAAAVSAQELVVVHVVQLRPPRRV